MSLSQVLSNVLSEWPLYPQHPKNGPSQQQCHARLAEARYQQAAGGTFFFHYLDNIELEKN